MPAPTEPRHLDHAIEMYLAGKPVTEIKATTGVGTTVLLRERRRRGVPARVKRLPVDDAALVAAYVGGESELAIAKRTGISRTVMRRRLIEARVPIRHPSEAQALRVSAMTPDARRRQAIAAQSAVRGRKRTMAQLEARARGIERDGKFDSEGERLLAQWLEEADLMPIPHKAIGKYNVDLAASDAVAVEVLGGNWHAAKRTHATRTPHILNAGWHLIMVWNQQPTGPITRGAAEYVATFCEEVRWHPTLIRQYRVVSGSGDLLATRCADDDEFPLIPPSRRAARLRP